MRPGAWVPSEASASAAGMRPEHRHRAGVHNGSTFHHAGRPMAETETYFRRGLGLKKEVQPVLDAEYHSALVAQIKAAEGHSATFGDITVKLAEEFGFCYGVDRA